MRVELFEFSFISSAHLAEPLYMLLINFSLCSQQLQHFIDPIDPKHEALIPAGSQQTYHSYNCKRSGIMFLHYLTKFAQQVQVEGVVSGFVLGFLLFFSYNFLHVSCAAAYIFL